MNITVDTPWIMGTILTSIRLGPLFIAAPGLGSLRIPVMARGLFVLALSAMMSGIWFSTFKAHAPNDVGSLLIMAISELFIGASLAFGLIAGFAAFQFGGRIIDLQIGFGIANVFDPITRAQMPLLGSALQLAALMVFFSIDGHLLLMRGLAYSLERIPLGTALTDIPLIAIMARFGAMFTFGLAVVAPVMIVMLLVDIGLAAISRTMPQVNVFFVTIPIKIFVGLMVLAVSTHYMGPVMRHIFESIFEYWQTVLR